MFATNTDRFGNSNSPLDVFLSEEEDPKGPSKEEGSDEIDSPEGKTGAMPEKKEVIGDQDDTDLDENDENLEEDENPTPPEEIPLIDETIIEEAGKAGVLDVLSTIDPEFTPSEEATVDEILLNFDEQRKEKLKKDPEFISQVRQEIMDEFGITEDVIVAVTNRKKGVNHKEYNEYKTMERYADLDFDDDQEIQNLFSVYYRTKGVAKDEAERLIGLDMQSAAEKEILVSERKQYLKDYSFSKIKELEEQADKKNEIIEKRTKEQRDFVRNALSTGVVGGKKRSVEEIELFKKMVALGTTEITLPTGEKVKVSRLQAYNYEKEYNVEQNFGSFFDEIISIGSGIKEVKDAAKAKSTQRGTFMKSVNNHLKNKKIDVSIQKSDQKTDVSRNRNEKSKLDVLNDD